MTKTPVKPDSLATELSRIKNLTTEELRAELAQSLGLTARHLLHLAAVWKELENRGEDLSDLRSGIGAYLPAIAAGTVLPETVVRYAGQPTLLRAVAALTPHEQHRLAEGGTVPLVVASGSGYTPRMLPAHALTAPQVRQVFGDRSIRNEAEQIALLTAVVDRPAKPGKSPKRGRVRADRDKRLIRIGRSVAPVGDVVAALGDLNAGEQTEEDPDTPVVVKLTEEEKRRLGHAAIDSNLSQQDLIRKALRAMGVI
jgi:hypothetical protein